MILDLPPIVMQMLLGWRMFYALAQIYVRELSMKHVAGDSTHTLTFSHKPAWIDMRGGGQRGRWRGSDKGIGGSMAGGGRPQHDDFFLPTCRTLAATWRCKRAPLEQQLNAVARKTGEGRAGAE